MIYHNYIFFSIDKGFYDLTDVKKTLYKEQFLKALQKEKSVIVNTYTTVGLKNTMSLMFWFQSDAVEDFQNFLNTLMHTKMGRYLMTTYTLFGMTRPTQYSSKSTGHLNTARKGGKYFVIYPFNKTKDWYVLDFDARRNLMGGHVMIGKKYPQIEQLLLYSYGIDDNEFLVSYEMDDLQAFQSLVMELRSDKVRAYTLKDTPIFTCVYKTAEEVLSFI